jgi:hypothetical protein
MVRVVQGVFRDRIVQVACVLIIVVQMVQWVPDVLMHRVARADIAVLIHPGRTFVPMVRLGPGVRMYQIVKADIAALMNPGSMFVQMARMEPGVGGCQVV